jgi:hypothetical protein
MLCKILLVHSFHTFQGRHGRMVVGFTTTCAIGAIHIVFGILINFDSNLSHSESDEDN